MATSRSVTTTFVRTLYTLTVSKAGAGSTFSGWGGACTGTGPCLLSMGGARNVTAAFTP